MTTRARTWDLLQFPNNDTTVKSLPSAVTLIQRRKSKIPAIKLRVLIHFACPSKNYTPKYSQKPHELFIYLFI